METLIIYPKDRYNYEQVKIEKSILGDRWKLGDDKINYYLRPDSSRLLKGGIKHG